MSKRLCLFYLPYFNAVFAYGYFASEDIMSNPVSEQSVSVDTINLCLTNYMKNYIVELYEQLHIYD